ncbi:sensor histidine kinase [Planomonospora venezuelensis]|uniref:histidine kinase n=1 Tax=Planomonospora venezuelensis TaxID=1999 RepID=A0A841CTS1_PLAVE|nr:histidine kinase [Planomonospora venezuelensis]MBB5961812.1 two-component system LytT family sensor kinase [Planomonospora venezuelensis]GIM99110.1 signal transduction histidine kinase [Planomonospora venezuelensis]
MSTSGWALLCVLCALLGFTLSRRRAESLCRPAGWQDEATFATLHVAAMAAPSLRAGLTPESARRAVRHLRTLLGTGAVALTGPGGVLAWDGAMECHRDHAAEHARAALASGRPQVVAGESLACGGAGCPAGGAVVVPLEVDGRVVGALAAYDAEVSAVLVRTVTEVARWVSGQLELAELDSSRRRAVEAEMRALRAQISPHFVYNSLTTIASFVRTDPERARELLVDFADFTRYALRRAQDFTTLADELHCVDRYLLLERARFGDRLSFTVRVAPEVLAVPVPFLCLQPLVENAVKHGLVQRGGSGEVRVVIEDAGPEAHISVEDDGLGMEPAHARLLLDDGPREGRGEGGIGLANVDRRLRQIYGEDYGLVVESALGSGTRVHLRVPKHSPAGSSL